MVISFLPTLLFPPPSSLFVTAMSILSCLSLAHGGYMETKGKHIQYSKFFNVANSKKPTKDQEIKLASRNGMLLLYTPAFLVGLVSFVAFRGRDLRLLMVVSALTIHFFKRVIEVLLVHKYSGYMALEAAIPITLSYTISTATMIYAQYLSEAYVEPLVDLKYVGATLFLIGITGNFYHHWILSNLRKKGDKEYKIPNGGLFNLVICPHYLFEILEFIGIACVSQTMYSVSFTIGTICYLMGRSLATREWYVLKFGEKFNKDVKALIPYIF
ncbi:putative 3-oxo-5-alpha-steroid 4-dehydrogenase (NADP(+)) [Helianthus annuus]|nr:putative 3-oxo-5-alpha-steroid 4-dehydrogenase (NADP(+)) [Helianthus annuus]